MTNSCSNLLAVFFLFLVSTSLGIVVPRSPPPSGNTPQQPKAPGRQHFIRLSEADARGYGKALLARHECTVDPLQDGDTKFLLSSRVSSSRNPEATGKYAVGIQTDDRARYPDLIKMRNEPRGFAVRYFLAKEIQVNVHSVVMSEERAGRLMHTHRGRGSNLKKKKQKDSQKAQDSNPDAS